MFLGAVSGAGAAPVSFDGTGHSYELVSTPLTWTAASSAALAMSFAGEPGYLATITSAEENQFIIDTFSPETTQGGDGYGFWLGANDVAQEGQWRWVVGPEAGTLFSSGNFPSTSIGFTFWGSNEPADWGAGEDHLLFDREGGSGLPEWDDKAGDSSRQYLVEYNVIPLPAAAWLWCVMLGGMAGVGAMRRKRRRPA